MLETNIALTFRHWVKANYEKLRSCSFETKSSRGKSYISYKELKDEQLAHGMANKSAKGNLIRVASGTVGAGDYMFYRNASAYFVIAYPESIEIIDVETLQLEIETSGKKSLTHKRATDMSIYSISLVHR